MASSTKLDSLLDGLIGSVHSSLRERLHAMCGFMLDMLTGSVLGAVLDASLSGDVQGAWREARLLLDGLLGSVHSLLSDRLHAVCGIVLYMVTNAMLGAVIDALLIGPGHAAWRKARPATRRVARLGSQLAAKRLYAMCVLVIDM